MDNHHLKNSSFLSFNLLLFLRIFRRLLFLIIILIFLTSILAHPTSRSKIDIDYNLGKIDINQRTLYKVYSIFAPQKLPYKYKEVLGEKCATSELRRILNIFPKLSEETKRLISPYLKFQIPDNLNEKLTTEHFIIYYTKNQKDKDCVLYPNLDNNQNGHPDYVDNTAQYLEESYEYLTNRLGYNPPPYKNYDHYRVYIANMMYYGFCSYDGEDTIIAIHNSMSLASPNSDPEGKVKGALKVTSAHELFHAVKAGYDWNEDEDYGYWWDEATSVWVEDIIYPYVDDYIRYIENWLSHPEYSLDCSEGTHHYGSSIFAKYITESHQYLPDNFGQDIIKNIWERCAKSPGGRSIYSIEEELEKRLTTLSSVFKNFATANYLKDYIDGEKFPDIATFSISTVPPDSSLILEFTGNTDTSWGGKIILIKKEGTKEIIDYPINEAKKGTAQIDNAHLFNQILFIVNNLSLNCNSKYSYTNNISSQSDLSLSYLATHYHLFKPSLTSIAISPTATTLNIGETTQFTATGTYADSSTADITSSVNWTSSNTNVGTINASGLFTALSFGTTNITATKDGITSNSVVITVNPPPVITSYHNYPNPFLGDKTNFIIEFTGGPPNYVVIEIYNLAQKLIERITDHNPTVNINNNTYTYQWQPKFKLANGVYLYRITFFSNITAFSKIGKIVVVR